MSNSHRRLDVYVSRMWRCKRNTMFAQLVSSEIHEEVQKIAEAIDAYRNLSHRHTRSLARRQAIGDDRAKICRNGDDVEPLHGKTYLPRNSRS